MTNAAALKDRKVSVLKGIGEKNEKLFEKVGVTDLNQLLHFYPRAYDFYAPAIPLSDVKSGEKAAVSVTVSHAPAIKGGGRTPVTILTVKEDFQVLEVVWYHLPYLGKILKRGAVFVFRGMITRRTGKWHMEHPEIFTQSAFEALSGTVQPVYPLTAGLSNKTVSKSVRQIFERYEIEEYLPEDLKGRYSLCGREYALKNIHFPDGERELAAASRRIIFDEFLIFLLGIHKVKTAGKDKNPFPPFDTRLSGRVRSSLPYELTGAQKKVLEELIRDINGPVLMNRLIQGDVGSGKTILCFIMMLIMADNGYQSALMAPTEVLAVQHHRSLLALMESCGLSLEPPVLLTGSRTAAEKKKIHESMKTGNAKLIIGTHALIQEAAGYRNLALVITDEQHRFGVKQRSMLGEKGTSPHILVMSATPIPRTLALMLYGDMKLSVLDEMPKSRLRVKNAVVDTTWREKAYRFIAKEITAGHQAYIVCPMIEKNEDFPCENVVEYSASVKKAFGGKVRVQILHGRMKEEEKNRIMAAFSGGEIDILVSTTVIEVGVDVANATVMMIENADRFGLAQLHQLRGRVGRGDAQSYCILVKSEGKEEENERLEILSSSNDGFFIAEEDLKLRGQGDLFGLRQSGIAGFDLADIFRDRQILEDASDAAEAILCTDPDLRSESFAALSEVLEEKYADMMTAL